MSRTSGSRETADALRAAVDRTFQATVDQAKATVDQATASRGRAQERAQDIVEELSQAAGRVREALDDLRVATREDVREISGRLDSLERRVAALEKPAKPKPKPASKRTKTSGGK